MNDYDAWFNHCKKYGYTNIAREQWDLFFSGVRDSRLADISIWLIDTFGYTQKEVEASCPIHRA